MKYFGTDGIRGKAEMFTPEFLGRIVMGLTKYADGQTPGWVPKVMLGGDTRESTEWILRDLATACETLGVEYEMVGVLPTPAINYCFPRLMDCDFAIDVTASHNPYTDNGIKIFERGRDAGVKLSEEGCLAVEEALESGKPYEPMAVELKDDLHAEALELYISHLERYVGEVSLAGLRIGMDCANGATSVVGAKVFEKLGAEVELINADASYGRAINNGCGSTHLEKIAELVREKGLDFGVAYDGDGDRCLMVDAKGTEVDGDEIIVILAEALGLDAVAITVMANQGLMNWASSKGVRTEITAVGDSNVAEAMRLHDIKIGGEQSGHIILPGEPTGDGMLTSLMVAKTVAESGKTLRELVDTMVKFPQVIVNMEASAEQKAALKTSEVAKKLLLEYDEKLKPVEGRLLVRPSGTEALVRITMWGNDLAAITALAEELKTKLGETL